MNLKWVPAIQQLYDDNMFEGRKESNNQENNSTVTLQSTTCKFTSLQV